MFPQSDFFTKASQNRIQWHFIHSFALCNVLLMEIFYFFGNVCTRPPQSSMAHLNTNIIYIFSVNFSLDKMWFFWEDDGTENTAFKQIPIMKKFAFFTFRKTSRNHQYHRIPILIYKMT